MYEASSRYVELCLVSWSSGLLWWIACDAFFRLVFFSRFGLCWFFALSVISFDDIFFKARLELSLYVECSGLVSIERLVNL